MNRALFRFYAELNEFLPPAARMCEAEHFFWVPAPVKDVIESFGVPHTEVELILINGLSADFQQVLQDGDRVSVYPVFESIDVTPILRVRPKPLRELRFVCDTHLGRLASYLRMLGFDTKYRNDFSDPELVEMSVNECRVLLTRDRALLKHRVITHGALIRNADPQGQLAEVVERFDLSGMVAPFTRCLRCNGLLTSVEKEQVLARLPAGAAHHYDEFSTCQGCGRLYWKGSHFRRMQQLVSETCAAR